jgi:hypothetical protein
MTPSELPPFVPTAPIPGAVYDAFNALIAAKWTWTGHRGDEGHAKIYKRNIVSALESIVRDIDSAWLVPERIIDAYEQAGFRVVLNLFEEGGGV